MLPLDDPRWKTFKGGYNIPYDASNKLRQLENAATQEEIEEILKEFWENLYHQGDVNIASYLTLPHLIRIAKVKSILAYDVPALVAVIEIARHDNNPHLPVEFVEGYEKEIKDVIDIIKMKPKNTWDKPYTLAAISALAAVFGQIQLAKIIIEMEDLEYLKNMVAFVDNIEEVSGWMHANGLIGERHNSDQGDLFN